MRLHYCIVSFFLTGILWGQIDTRVDPAPTSTEEMQNQPTSKWTGAPLTGFLSETLGSSLKEGLETSLAVSEFATNQAPAQNRYGMDEDTRLTGTVSLSHGWSRASVLTQYSGGSDSYVKNSYSNDQFHQFSASEALKLSRWNLSLGQSFKYLPQSSFGFDPARVVGNGVAGSIDAGSFSGPDLFLPANVIERTISTQASAQYVLGTRSGVTFNGGFSDLHFVGVSPRLALVDSEMFTSGAQYTYAVNGNNSIGGGYNFSQGRALGFGSLIQTHSVQANYMRKIGNRLSVQASAGPQFTSFNQNGIEITLGASTTVTASANYQLGRTSFEASYFRGTNAGSGLFLGSRTNDFRGFVGRQFGRSLHISVAGGYGRNDNLDVPAINNVQQVNSTYLTATVERGFGRMVSCFISYSLQNQDTNAALCKAAGCNQFLMMHSGTIGLRFHIHPLTLRP